MEDNHGISLGYGFVEFENKDSAYSAYRKLDRARFNGIRVYITVEWLNFVKGFSILAITN